MLDQQTATDQGWAVGDQISVLTGAGPKAFTLVGTATFGAVDGVPGSSLVATTDDAAQECSASPAATTTCSSRARGDEPTAALADRIVAEVAVDGSGLEAITGEQDTADKQADFAKDLSFFNTFLMSFAYVALFVGTFIIYNTFSIVVAQRVKDLAMLRAIGARSSQVLRSVAARVGR